MCSCDDVKDKWRNLPLTAKLIPPFALAAFISTLLGFAVPLWITAPKQIDVTLYSAFEAKSVKVQMDHLGLWQVCGSEHGCIGVHRDLPGWIIATRIFMTLGFIGSFVISTMVFLFYSFEKLEKNSRYRWIFIKTVVFTAICIFVAVIIWGIQSTMGNHLSFAFAMACIGGIMYTATGVTLVVYFIKNRR